jgi:hypothetical protein
MSDDDKRKIVDSAKQAFPELQSFPDDKVEFTPPDDPPKSDTLQFFGSLPGQIKVWVRRSKLGWIVAVYLLGKDAYSLGA